MANEYRELFTFKNVNSPSIITLYYNSLRITLMG